VRQGRSPLAVSEVETARLSSRDLEGAQVVVLTSDALVSDSQAQILTDFVRDGGGLMVLSGQRSSADPTNRLLLERLGGARVRGIVQSQQGYVNLADLRPTSILAGFKQNELRALEAVKFTRYAELATGPDTRGLLRFSGGQPALVEGAHGNGRYMVAGFDAGLDGSDLAVSPMFLPLLHRSVVYLAGETGRQRLDAKVGERLEVQFPIAAGDRQAASDAASETRLAQAGTSDGGARPTPSSTPAGEAQFTVTTPSGQKEALVARYVGRMAILTYEDTREPGHYVFEGAGRRAARAVNVDHARIEPRAPRHGRSREAARHRCGRAASIPRDDVARQVREARHGKEIYKLIVGLVLMLLTLELFLSRGNAGSRRRAELTPAHGPRRSQRRGAIPRRGAAFQGRPAATIPRHALGSSRVQTRGKGFWVVVRPLVTGAFRERVVSVARGAESR
jgi:hypothetical protein